MIDTRANPYRHISLSSEQEQVVARFNVTQQLGFKPVLHCVCGASMDMNLRGNGKQALRAFKLAHEECNAAVEASEASYEEAWEAYKRIEPRYSESNRKLAGM